MKHFASALIIGMLFMPAAQAQEQGSAQSLERQQSIEAPLQRKAPALVPSHGIEQPFLYIL
ncbi:MAG: hypothetical protein ACFCU8_04545 [Thermosynechococcaceae cyanobacterium]